MDVLQAAVTQAPPAIKSGGEHVRRAFRRKYANARASAAIELLNDRSTSAESARSLLEYVEPRSVLPDQKGTRRAEILVALSRYDRQLALAAIEGILAGDHLHFEYRSAMEGLRRISPGLFRARFDEALCAVRWQFVLGFTEVCQESSPAVLDEFLPAMLHHSDSRVRLLAALQLADRSDPRGLSVLRCSVGGERTDDIEMFGDQRLAFRALGELYDKGGRGALMERLGDNRVFSGLGTVVREMAALEIVAHASEEDLPAIRRLLQEGAFHIRRGALEALLRLRPQEALPRVRTLLKDEDPNFRLWAALVLARKGAAAATRYLEACSYQNLGMGGTSVQYLIQARTEESLAAFRRVLKGEAPYIKYSFRHCSTDDLVTVWPDVVASGNEDARMHFWLNFPGDKLTCTSKALDVIRRDLQTGENRGHHVLPALKRTVAKNRGIGEADRGAAAEILSVLVESQDAQDALGASHLALGHGLLPRTVIRKVCLRFCHGWAAVEALELLAECGQPRDIPLLLGKLKGGRPSGGLGRRRFRRRLFDKHLVPIHSALAIRRTLRRSGIPGQ